MQNKFLMMHVLGVNNKDRLFKNLFKINEKVLKDIEDDMRMNGFNMAFPLIIWGGNMRKLVDGFTRLQAAKNAGLLDVPVVAIDVHPKSFLFIIIFAQTIFHTIILYEF